MQYNYELHHKPGEQNKADTLSRHPDYATKNHTNQHLIVLPCDCFKGMPLGLWDGPTLNLIVSSLGKPGDTILADNLDKHIKIGQDTHFSTILL